MKRVMDNIYGREVSRDHMVDLIAINESDLEFERGELHHLTKEEACKEIEANLEYYMKRHDYEWIE